MKIRYFLPVLLGGAALALAACGGSSTEATPAPAAAPAPVQEPAAAPVITAAPEKALDEMEVTKTLDFVTADPADWGWVLPGGSTSQTEQGAWYTTSETQTGPDWRTASFLADDVSAVRVTVLPFSEHGRAEVRDISLYWMRSTDELVDGWWPYTNARRVYFTQNPDNRRQWVARPDRHAEWNGEINALYIRYTVAVFAPDGEDGEMRVPLSPEQPVSVYTRRIEFLD